MGNAGIDEIVRLRKQLANDHALVSAKENFERLNAIFSPADHEVKELSRKTENNLKEIDQTDNKLKLISMVGEAKWVVIVTVPFGIFVFLAMICFAFLGLGMVISLLVGFVCSTFVGIVLMGLFAGDSPDNLRKKIDELNAKIATDQQAIASATQRRNAIQPQYEAAKLEFDRQVARTETIRSEIANLESLVKSSMIGSRNWRHLRGVPFEDFLQETFQSLGYGVETTPTSGDYGIDLIVVAPTERYAVQVKGYEGTVGNSAIQEAYTGMRHYNCNKCVVITNSNFSRNAMELAQSVGCQLLGEPDIDNLVQGKIFPRL